MESGIILLRFMVAQKYSNEEIALQKLKFYPHETVLEQLLKTYRYHILFSPINDYLL